MYTLGISSIDPFNMNIGQACLIALVCIIIVFAMLALLWGIVELFKFIPAPKGKQAAKKEVNNVFQKSAHSLKMEDIKDDDMMAAALVASIDYHNETKEDVRVVSIKEL
jgi:hypothetical protein